MHFIGSYPLHISDRRVSKRGFCFVVPLSEIVAMLRNYQSERTNVSSLLFYSDNEFPSVYSLSVTNYNIFKSEMSIAAEHVPLPRRDGK